MFHSLALITIGLVRTVVRSIEESNGAEALRLTKQVRPPIHRTVKMLECNHDAHEDLVSPH